jgi:hypothetical protein
LAFLRSIPLLEFKIMKIRLLVVSALLAIGLAACGDDAKKAEAARLASEAKQKADEAAKKAGAKRLAPQPKRPRRPKEPAPARMP